MRLGFCRSTACRVPTKGRYDGRGVTSRSAGGLFYRTATPAMWGDTTASGTRKRSTSTLENP
ncbi:hypothetical protein, partial [Rubrivirga sp.]|uniref:hypothetical protein n=1 Tax=Rubrivirga sp. TaxID=1885344 RepID=UPI003C77C081